MMKNISLGILCLGFVLVAIGGLWSSLFPATAKWTNEKATHSAEVKARMAYLGGIVNSTNSSRSAAEVQKAKTEFDSLSAENEQLNSEFNSADGTPKTVSKVLWWSGISVMLVGIFAWYATNQARYPKYRPTPLRSRLFHAEPVAGHFSAFSVAL